MRKFFAVTLSVMFVCFNVYAKDGHCSAEHMGGGFLDTSMQPMSVAEIKKLPEDRYVAMQGMITKKISKDKYNFTDGEDNIVVEIENKKWHGQIVSPKDKVMIYGEVEHEDGVCQIDVKSIQLMK